MKCNIFYILYHVRLILAKLNFGIRTVVFCTQEFQTCKALNLINPTKNTSSYSKAKEDKKKEKKKNMYTKYQGVEPFQIMVRVQVQLLLKIF